ncbi:hypothetical protein AQJ43_23710 [Streptomyces avermitilis]|uniref:Cell-cycle regulator n=2 Tax=Streptomyces avermitilis TaxID=33903 RepID=Q82C32_STRAW|nr:MULTISPECIES: helix-turn-helix domain containing protein [Streptomyces]KUN52235.1 hypothetical protein AQJ43_23710 [Streptomyces avermitilis]MYT01102.1 helix-turn-helix domain containing protein [Streptomyces sp. SID5469]OOV30717.1 helix-turn-helix domain containing protein [Streptomyces avermitilis]BAC73234.1 putative cell-cycle regulator [Streptomyces avermitilis MA-4680 = NBRC 14893]BBJ53677.1 hypothetical protein SAVMC3_63060 [Streptomyces avermitilis]
MARTFSEADEATLRQLHADGVSRNAIARQMGFAVGTITNHARRLGLSFDREAVRAATDARQVDLKDQRQQAQQRLMDFFNHQLDRAESRYLVTGWTHTGAPVAEWLQEPPARETKDLTSAATQALDRALKLAQFDAEHDDKNLSAMDRFLGAMLSERPEQDE